MKRSFMSSEINPKSYWKYYERIFSEAVFLGRSLYIGRNGFEVVSLIHDLLGLVVNFIVVKIQD